MPVVSSSYWNNVHGISAEQVSEDKEGLQTMRNIGHNMAWMLKCIEKAKMTESSFPGSRAENGRTSSVNQKQKPDKRVIRLFISYSSRKL